MPLRRYTFKEDAGTLRPMGWLTTFNDMMTLLMVFFVMLFSMGTIDVDRFRSFQNQLQSAMGVMYEGQNAPVGLVSDEQWYVEDNKRAPERSGNQVENFKALAQNQGLEAEYTPRGIQLILNDELLFRSGSARLTEDGKVLLTDIAKVVKDMNRTIRVEGHTDDRPIDTARYPSNWELSTARAISVVKFFIMSGLAPERISAAGYSDVKPRVENDSEVNRSKNRRVEIILGQTEPTEQQTPSFEGE